MGSSMLVTAAIPSSSKGATTAQALPVQPQRPESVTLPWHSAAVLKLSQVTCSGWAAGLGSQQVSGVNLVG